MSIHLMRSSVRMSSMVPFSLLRSSLEHSSAQPNVGQPDLKESGLKQPSVYKRPVVLAVDDDEDNLLLLSHVLELLDCDFVGKTSGEVALNFIKECLPKLILLDVLLPDMNGVDFVRCLKQDEQTRHIPTIAVTGLSASEHRETLLSEGFSDYLGKPYMIDELEAMVQHYLKLAAAVFSSPEEQFLEG